MLIPSVQEIELLTGEAIAAVEVVSASQFLWPVEGFTKPLADAYRQDSRSIDAAFTKARDGIDQVPNSLTLIHSMSERPLIALLHQMHRLEASLWACIKCPVFTSLHGGEDKNYEFLDFVEQHTAKQRPHRYLVWDGNEEQCCGFLTAHEVAFWWLSWVRNFEHYCQSRLFNPKSGWWLKEPADLCARLEMDAKNYSKAPRLDSENLKELIRDESMAMLSTIGGNHWNRRAGINVTEWLTSPARFDVDEIEVFIDHDGWPKLICNTKVHEPERTVDPEKAPLFGMDIHEKSKTVTRRDSLGFERTCSIQNPEQWKLFSLAVNHNGTLSKPQVHKVFPVKAERDRNVAALRKELQKIQLTFNAVGKTFVLKEF